MRHAVALLLVLVGLPAWAADIPRADFTASVAAPVFTAALQFIAPRALDAVTVRQLTLWGLRAVTTLDPALTQELRDDQVMLRRGAAILFQRKAPPEDDATQWGGLAADLAAAAWAASPAIRSGGAQALTSSFFDELFNHLDPYSRYVAPDAADEDRARRSGEAGAGLQLRKAGPAFYVQQVNADGPGAEAGIRAGDQLLAVDDQPVAGEELDTVLEWIAGIEGTTVSLTVRRRGSPARTVDVERVVLPPETVFASRIGDLLLLRISAFSSDTDLRLAREMKRALDGKPGAAVKAIVLDLRGNRGGLLRQAVAATDLLVDTGPIATTAGRNPQAARDWRAGTGDVAGGRPVIVLVDGRTASAAEIMAAALGDNGRGVVVGSSTLGKGLVQTIATLPDDGELFVSWSRVLAPGGWPIQGLGVLPQICTSLGQQQVNQQLASLEKGSLALSPALARHHAARAPLPAAEIVELRNACPAAGGRDTDLTVARFLANHPDAYRAARLELP